MKDEVV
jgi:hypothetical protein